MPAKMGGFRSPKGVRKTQLNPMGQKPGKTATMPASMPSMITGMKKGGMVSKKKASR